MVEFILFVKCFAFVSIPVIGLFLFLWFENWISEKLRERLNRD